jgi:TRAP-type C4-dicarboxylate transport system substrate-binding protein
MFRKFVTMFSVIALGVGLADAASAATVIKIGTVAPPNSPWAKGFKQWAADVAADTNGELQIDFLWNGQAGDDVLMVQKMRSGQLDGAAVTSAGLAQTGVTDVLLFQLPGLFTSWQKLDTARDATKDEFNKLFEAKGFTIVNWGDVGAAKQMTVGFQIHHPADLQGKLPFTFNGDTISPKLYSTIGGITPKQLSVMEVLPALSSGTVNVLTAPPLAAEQLQWGSRITDVCSDTTAFITGAIMVTSSRLQSLPPKLRDAFLARGLEDNSKLNTTIRNLDAQSFARMKSTKNVYSLTEGEKTEWKDTFTKVVGQLRGTVFTPAMFDKIVQLAGNPYLSK